AVGSECRGRDATEAPDVAVVAPGGGGTGPGDPCLCHRQVPDLGHWDMILRNGPGTLDAVVAGVPAGDRGRPPGEGQGRQVEAVNRPGSGPANPMAPTLGTGVGRLAGPWCGRREQAEGAGLLDGLTAVVCAELVVQVTHVRPDGVHGQVELACDLRRGEVGGQVAQDTGLGLAERLAQARRFDGWCGGPASFVEQ